MPQRDLFRAPRTPWNSGRLIGPKPPLKPKHIWAIRQLLRSAGKVRDLALFNLALDAKLRGCDLVALRVRDVAIGGAPRHRATVVQQKTGRPVPFEITEPTRVALAALLMPRDGRADDWLFPSQSRPGAHITTRQYSRLVDAWVARVDLPPAAYGTHSLLAGELKRYLGSAEFFALAPSTQAEYRRIADHLERELGSTRLSDCTRRWVRTLRDRWARGGHRFASMRLQVLKNALAIACDEELVSAHLFANVRKVGRPSSTPEPNAAWTDDEVEAVIEDALQRDQDGLARAVALGRWAGYRRGTVCEITVDARVQVVTEAGVERRLRWTTEKTGVVSDKLEDPRLTELLDRTQSCDPYLAYNIYGFAWTPRQLSQALERVVERLAEAGEVRPNLSMHGLRHARGAELAHVGASDAVIMAQLEHKTTHSARIYRRQAERAQLADLGQSLINEAIASGLGTGSLARGRRHPLGSSGA